MKTLWSVILLIVMLLLSACSSNKIFSQRTKQKIVVDGKFDDWTEIELSFNKQPPFMIGSSNSYDRLYLVIRSNDVNFLQQMRLFGFVLWLDKEKSLALELPGLASRWDGMGKKMFARRLKKGEKKRPQVLNSNHFFLMTGEKRIPLAALHSFSVASSFKDGVLTLEFGFPLLQRGTDGPAVFPQNGQLTIGFQFTSSVKKNGPPGGGGVFGRGRRMTENSPGRPPARSRQLSTKDIWFNIVLAKKISGAEIDEVRQ